jgi:hypothetical protein
VVGLAGRRWFAAGGGEGALKFGAIVHRRWRMRNAAEAAFSTPKDCRDPILSRLAESQQN